MHFARYPGTGYLVPVPVVTFTELASKYNTGTVFYISTRYRIYRYKSVHKEYAKKAQAADRKWNNTPEGSVGPIESRLYEFGTVTPFVFGFLGEANKAVRETIKDMASIGSEYLWRQMGQTCQNNAYGILLRKLTRTLGVAATRANARMRLRVLGTLFGRRDDSQYNRASREEARFREAEWDNYLRHGPRGHAEYHHGFEHCI